jgi:hypothetical protein
MYDISLCTGYECPLRNTCLRFTLEVFGRQSFMLSPYNKQTQTCEHFKDNLPQLQQMAYYLWIADGKPEGKNEEHWQQANQNLLDRLVGL